MGIWNATIWNQETFVLDIHISHHLALVQFKSQQDLFRPTKHISRHLAPIQFKSQHDVFRDLATTIILDWVPIRDIDVSTGLCKGEPRIKLCSNNFKILESVDVVMIVQGINRRSTSPNVSKVKLLRSCPDPFPRLPELLEIMKLRIISEFQELMIEILSGEFLDK